MNFYKTNEFLTRGMIATFIAIIPLSLLGIVFPILGYVVASLILVLLGTTTINFFLSAILMGYELSKAMDQFFKLSNEQRQ